MKRPSVRALAPLLVFPLLVTGCRSKPELKDMKPEEAYQTVANQLPRADFGWGTPPGIAEMAASERNNKPRDFDRDLLCNEQRMKLILEVFRPYTISVRYDAIEDVSYAYSLFPNLLFCFVFPFLQVSETRVVFDGNKIPGLFEHIESECTRLEQISREIGVGAPYGHAQAVRQKLRDDARAFGPGRLSVSFSYTSPVPPFIPYPANARRTAEAFQWVKAHPDEPPLPEKPKDADPKGDKPK